MPRDVSVKVSVVVAPTVSTTTAIRVIGVMMFTFATPVTPEVVARICAEPSPRPVTSPVVSTEATAGAVDDQVKVGLPGSGKPFPSTAAAVKVNQRVR